MTIAARLTAHLKNLNPAVIGVSIGDQAVRSTWKVQPPSLQAALQSAIDAFNPDDPAIVSAERDADANRLAEDLLVRSLARATWEELQKMQPKAGQTPLDLQGFRDRIKALYRNLLG